MPALAQPLMFTRYAMHWTGDRSLFPYTGRTPAQCFLCFLMYNYAYFNFIICMFFTYITCFVIITVLNILPIKKIIKKKAITIRVNFSLVYLAFDQYIYD